MAMTEKTKHLIKVGAVSFGVGVGTSLNSSLGYNLMVKVFDKLDFKYQKKLKRYKALQVKLADGTLTTDESNELSELGNQLNDWGSNKTRKASVEDNARYTVGLVNTLAGFCAGFWSLNEEIKFRNAQKKEKPAADKPKTNAAKGTKK